MYQGVKIKLDQGRTLSMKPRRAGR